MNDEGLNKIPLLIIVVSSVHQVSEFNRVNPMGRAVEPAPPDRRA
jgi:hypothetical protein